VLRHPGGGGGRAGVNGWTSRNDFSKIKGNQTLCFWHSVCWSLGEVVDATKEAAATVWAGCSPQRKMTTVYKPVHAAIKIPKLRTLSEEYNHLVPPTSCLMNLLTFAREGGGVPQ